jgi:hypothetical protein
VKRDDVQPETQDQEHDFQMALDTIAEQKIGRTISAATREKLTAIQELIGALLKDDSDTGTPLEAAKDADEESQKQGSIGPDIHSALKELSNLKGEIIWN